MAIKKITVLANQTIYNLAIKNYGSVSGVFTLMEDNPGIDLETDLEEGMVLKVDTDKVEDERVVAYFKNIDPANELGEDPFKGAFSIGFSNGFEIGES